MRRTGPVLALSSRGPPTSPRIRDGDRHERGDADRPQAPLAGNDPPPAARIAVPLAMTGVALFLGP